MFLRMQPVFAHPTRPPRARLHGRKGLCVVVHRHDLVTPCHGITRGHGALRGGDRRRIRSQRGWVMAEAACCRKTQTGQRSMRCSRASPAAIEQRSRRCTAASAACSASPARAGRSRRGRGRAAGRIRRGLGQGRAIRCAARGRHHLARHDRAQPRHRPPARHAITGDARADGAAETIADAAPDTGRGSRCDSDRARLDDASDDEQRGQTLIRTAFFEGATYEELATRTGSPLGSVKSWIRRGLLQLRECLDQ